MRICALELIEGLTPILNWADHSTQVGLCGGTHLMGSTWLNHSRFDKGVKSFIDAANKAARILIWNDAQQTDIFKQRTAEVKFYIRACNERCETTDYQYLAQRVIEDYRTKSKKHQIQFGHKYVA